MKAKLNLEEFGTWIKLLTALNIIVTESTFLRFSKLSQAKDCLTPATLE